MRSLLLIAILIAFFIFVVAMPVSAGYTDKKGKHHNRPYLCGCLDGSDLLNFLLIIVAMKISAFYIRSKKLQLTTGCLS